MSDPTSSPVESDVLVVGTGAAGLIAALSARAAGLSVTLIEKAAAFGGTTATSGGVFWAPNHGLGGLDDSPDKALTYLRAVTGAVGNEPLLRAFVDRAPDMVRFLQAQGIALEQLTALDYYPEAPGSMRGRSLAVRTVKGDALGPRFESMRAPAPMRTLFGRYALDRPQAFKFAGRTRGWQWAAAKLVGGYWLDIKGRLRSRRHRRATGGDALVIRLIQALEGLGVQPILDCALRDLVIEDGRVTGALADHRGAQRMLCARRGIILAAGGHEQNQLLRDAHLPVSSQRDWSLTPRGANAGDALLAARRIGAADSHMQGFWWMPIMRLPGREANSEASHAMAFDQRNPNSIMVNRLGERFVNENYSYDRFGLAMIADQQRTGANCPCWMIFDATYRRRYSCGGLMPTLVTPDWRVPREYWGRYLFRAPSIAALAEQIDIPAATLEATVARFNGFARAGVDPDFGRGSSAFDLARGDRRVKPNGCLGPLDAAPYYAVRIDLGDIGTKGGLSCDDRGRVLDEGGAPIPGLYAAGNAAASPFADAYPGAGGTIGPALTFGFIAGHDCAGNGAAS